VLDRGEAVFRVHQYTNRPFDVSVGSASVRATGTQFWIRRLADDAMDAAVKEGTIRLQLAADAGSVSHADARWSLGPTETVRVRHGEVSLGKSTLAQIDRELAWADTHLDLDETLGEAVQKFNLHNGVGKLVIEDSALESINVIGTFDWSQPQDFAASLQDQGVGYHISADGSTIVLTAHTP
jgi:transmembrane sensor